MIIIHQLRGRISELESAIDHGTGPEVERLTKEVSTLEDLLEETQRDNKAKHAESERQKQYVKVGKKSYCNKKSVADKSI